MKIFAFPFTIALRSQNVPMKNIFLMHYKFASPLQVASILSRPNRFIMNILLDGKEYIAHCPTTGRIGDIDFSKSSIACLVSESVSEKRKTKYTVEAISLAKPEAEKYDDWVGINQGKANNYVKYFLQNQLLSNMISGDVKSEVAYGKSRLDFLVGGSFLEVKMPLMSIQAPEHLNKLKAVQKKSFSRLIKHFGELADSLDTPKTLPADVITAKSVGQGEKKRKITDLKKTLEAKKALVALVFMYNAPEFVPPSLNSSNAEIISAATKASDLGVQSWQINMKVDKNGVSLLDYFRITKK